jgi:hypothetical protein
MQGMTLTKDRPVLSSERAPHKKKQDHNCQTVLIGARHQDFLTDWPSQCDFDLIREESSAGSEKNRRLV